mgnify:FL=1
MIPMIINVAEFKKVKEFIEEAKLELAHEARHTPMMSRLASWSRRRQLPS